LSGDPVAIIVQDVSSSSGVPAPAQLSRWVRSALDGGLRGEVTLRIVDEAESAELNARYRRRTGPTNVLAFAGGTDEAPAAGGERLPAGDLIVCAAVVEREAAAQGRAPAAHWAHVVMHGALHLVGYDHEAPAEAERMEARERELLAAFGFPDPYA
jgi:probable rRNA maturation factor